GDEAPVLVVVGAPRGQTSSGAAAAAPAATRTAGASIYPAVQNLLLAARARGIGGCLTTIHLFREAQVKAALGIPEDVDTYALIPLGYPRGNFGPLPGPPVGEGTFLDRWGRALGWGGLADRRRLRSGSRPGRSARRGRTAWPGTPRLRPRSRAPPRRSRPSGRRSASGGRAARGRRGRTPSRPCRASSCRE